MKTAETERRLEWLRMLAANGRRVNDGEGEALALEAEATASLLSAATARVRELEQELTGLEMAPARLRGMQDFLSGQPREMPYREGGDATNHMQLNFAWCLGYDSVAESDLWKLLVSRADRSVNRAEAAEAHVLALQVSSVKENFAVKALDAAALWTPESMLVLADTIERDPHYAICEAQYLRTIAQRVLALQGALQHEQEKNLTRVEPLDAGAAPQGSIASSNQSSPSLPSGTEPA